MNNHPNQGRWRHADIENRVNREIRQIREPRTLAGPHSVRIIHFRKEMDRMNRMNRIPKEQNDNGLVRALSCGSGSSCSKHLFWLRLAALRELRIFRVFGALQKIPKARIWAQIPALTPRLPSGNVHHHLE